MSKKIITPEFRVSFPSIFEPIAFEGNTPKYSLTMIFNKTDDLSEIESAVQFAIEEKWSNKKTRPAKLKLPLRDGSTDRPNVEGYENCIFIHATNKLKPGLVDKDLSPIISPEDFYAGCYARATLNVFAFDTKGNRGVTFFLQNIQKLRDGESFSGRISPEADFKSVENSNSSNDPKNYPTGSSPSANVDFLK